MTTRGREGVATQGHSGALVSLCFCFCFPVAWAMGGTKRKAKDTGGKRKTQAVEEDGTRRLTLDETKAMALMKEDMGLSWERLAEKTNQYYPVQYTGEGLRKAKSCFGFGALFSCLFLCFLCFLCFLFGSLAWDNRGCASPRQQDEAKEARAQVEANPTRTQNVSSEAPPADRERAGHRVCLCFCLFLCVIFLFCFSTTQRLRRASSCSAE
jgi:hypothetical protein